MNKNIKTIVLEGDSHTWGEGVGGELTFQPADTAGDRRPVPLILPNYVNILRRKVCEVTKSCAYEHSADNLNTIYNIRHNSNYPLERGCVKISKDRPLSFDCDGSLFSFWIRLCSKTSRGVLLIDGKIAASFDMTGDENPLDYVKLAAFADDSRHSLSFVATEGDLYLYRLECYSGEYAVLNGGVGSCAAGEYLNLHFKNEVERYSPDIIVLECNTINDWLRRESPEAYKVHIRGLIERSLKLTKNVIIHNVLPILGPKAEPYSPYDIDSLTAVIGETAAEYGITFVDVDALANKKFEGMSDADIALRYYHDCWHPNEYGYAFYHEPLWQEISALLK